MKFKELVCSLYLSKKLKELGIKQESHLYWVEYIDKKNEPEILEGIFDGYNNYPKILQLNYTDQSILESNEFLGGYGYETDNNLVKESFSAFTSGELFELLPAFIDIKKDEPFNNFCFELIKRSIPVIRYIANYYCDTMEFNPESIFFNLKLIKPGIYGENLSNCLAKALIYLMENNLIDIKDFKEKE